MSDTNDAFAPLDEWGDTAKPCKKHPRYTVTIDQVCPACNAEEDGERPDGHKWHKCPPTGCIQEGHCPYCDGGLGLCVRCMCAEGSLPTHCPGKPVDRFAQEEIYGRQLDFIDGQWIEVVLLED